MATITAKGADVRLTAGETDSYRKEGFGAFPGIYCSGIRENKPQDYMVMRYAPAFVVLDPYLLNRRDYHINSVDDYGRILDFTFSRENIADFLDHLTAYQIGEIVFHNHIEPNFIMDVVDMTDNDEKVNVPAVLNFYEHDQKIIDTVYAPLLMDEKKHRPRFCTGQFDAYAPRALFRVARNCGFTSAEIKSQKNGDLWPLIRDKVIKMNKSQSQVPPTLYYPPFTDESSPILSEDAEAYHDYLQNKT